MTPTHRPRSFPTALAPFRWMDGIIIIASLVGALFFFPMMAKSSPPVAVIYINNVITSRYPLNENRTIEISSPGGLMHAQIKDGAIRITDSPCPHHLCMEAGAIRHQPQQLVCAPNHLLIQIESMIKSDEGPDAVLK